MSRSVRQDYDKLRTPEPEPAPEPEVTIPVLHKFAAVMLLSEEQVFDGMSWTDERYHRRADAYNVSPTNEDWAKYHRARAGLLALQNYEGTVGLEEVEVPMPKPETHYRFTETHESWIERCRALQAERNAA
jgi:hypothetical protein